MIVGLQTHFHFHKSFELSFQFYIVILESLSKILPKIMEVANEMRSASFEKNFY